MKKIDGEGDIFKEYESFDQGIISPYCKKSFGSINSINRNIVLGNKISSIYIVQENTNYCPNTNDSICVIIENGISINDTTILINERDAMTVQSRTNKFNEGVIIERKSEKSSDCETGHN